MKPLPAIAVGMLTAFLLLSPIASAASSVTVAVAPTAVTGSQTVNITGGVSPAPGSGFSAYISVKNPQAAPVAAAVEPVDPATGAFAYSFTAGGSNTTWTTGVYTVTATVNGVAGMATFGYTAAPQVPPYNTTRAFINILGNLTKIEGQITVLQNNDATEQKDMKGNFSAISSAISTLQSSLSSSISTLTGDVTTLSSSVSSIQNTLTSMQGTLNTINTNVQALNTPINNAATQATNAVNAVNSTQTYVLVVAVLAAITLVLELAILVRKLS
jgi:hypothetical protein